MPVKGYLFIIIAAGLWGMVGPLSKMAFREGVSPMEVAFWRAMLAWGFFGLHAAFNQQVHIRKKDVPLLVLFGVAGVALFYGAYQMAVNLGGAALAAVLLYSAPAWVAMMSRFFFKETIQFFKIAALGLTLTGVGVISLAGAGATGSVGPGITLSALFFGLLAGFCYALYYIFGKYFAPRYTAPTIFCYILPIGAACLFPWITFVHKTVGAWTALLLLSAFSTYGAYYFYYIGLQYLEPTRAAITATLEPVTAGIIAFFWFGEHFNLAGYAGSLMILSAVILIAREGRIRVGRDLSPDLTAKSGKTFRQYATDDEQMPDERGG